MNETRVADSLANITVFDVNFWIKTMSLLGYPVRAEDLDIATLKMQKAIPSDVSPRRIARIYANDYVEVALFDLEKGSKITRSVCTRIARSWKENRLTRPLLLFTNGKDSYAVIVTGKGTGGEVKVLGLSDRLYRTDLEVINSMAYPGCDEEMRDRYDKTFFPYEKVRNEFFEGYKDLYQRINEAVKKGLNDNSTSYAQRFLGRLMFLYFLQRKGWLNNDKQFIDGIKDYRALNELFYESLNKEGTPGIPFLNGSLFEREGYMDEEMENRLYADMDVLFKEARKFFDQYNFTVDELAPLEVDVSIDPALIGTVFENMLPEYERGSKGTFYTPPSETSFICRRALANYLGFNDEISPDGKEFIDGLALYLDKLRKSKSEKEIREFKEKLLSIRVLDPAVGSGGFLLVMMQEIVSLIQEAEKIVGWASDSLEYKKRILPNLYGFDIEPEAIEIARLRLWLSLIIDQKEAEPLPNLDMNLIVIRDSLMLPNTQTTLDIESQEQKERFEEVRAKYVNEHSSNKNRLREQLEKISEQIREKTGTDPSVIEAFMPEPADIVVMNPPYVRQESIPEKKKNYYTSKYNLDKKSDLYAFFLVRSLWHLSEDGVVSVISSDKWLESGYGISLQERLKEHLIAVYGQKKRSFGADINTVITVYAKQKKNLAVHFTYLNSYSENEVIQDVVIEKAKLKPGKWFYLRDGSRFFLEKILPKLTHKLRDFADIKRGFTTGANDFFYMKDISHLYEADRLADPKKFEEWGVKAANRRELEEQGLIYIENEGGKRFVIDKKDVTPLIRSPKQLDSYLIKNTVTFCLYTEAPGEFTKQYIRWGEQQTVEVRGKKQAVKGYNSLETTKNRDSWFKLLHLKPTKVLLPMFLMDRLYIPISRQPVICDNTLYTLNSKDPEKVWLYLTSTVFLMTMEIWGRRLGGGGGALEIMVEDYQGMPVPNLSEMKIDYDPTSLLSRKPLRYYEEIKQQDRKELDVAVLRAMGFENSEALLPELYKAFVDLVEDRLVKARPPQTKESTPKGDNE
ncbi:MAG: DNA methyltransferase [Thermoplasmatales archaeon]